MIKLLNALKQSKARKKKRLTKKSANHQSGGEKIALTNL